MTAAQTHNHLLLQSVLWQGQPQPYVTSLQTIWSKFLKDRKPYVFFSNLHESLIINST